MAACSVFVQKNQAVITASQRLPGGIYVDCEPIIVCELTDLEKVGSAVTNALSAFREGDQTTSEKEEFEKKLFRVLRVRSWSSLENLTDYVNVELPGEKVRIRPSVRGEFGGYEFVDPLICASLTNTQEIGHAIQQAVDSMRRRRS